ncbi:carbohydrate ABC transporter permease [Kouleothrix sp.]|uniref:carbohydrate ABC transporter permease n=1 Tax=Kouleothrix sp. TaxID=2779161 RepID=UPI00391D20E8
MAQLAQARAGRRHGWSRAARREALHGWLFALPWLLGFALFTAGPMLFSLYTSFTRYNMIAAPRWLGLRNYQQILTADDRFYIALKNTFWMVGVKVPIVVVVSIAIALLLNMNLPGAKAFRAILYLPSLLAGAAAVFLWRWILAPQGLLNRGLALLSIPGPAWFIDPSWTKPGLVVMGLWYIGGNVLIYLAGLKGIPRQLYDAAEIDGAGRWDKLRYITLPMLSPTIFFQVVTGIIGTFQIFTSAYIIVSGYADNTREGPGQSLLFYVLYMYNRAFGRTGQGGFQMGYASALAWILMLIILAITLVQLWLARRWVYYENEASH